MVVSTLEVFLHSLVSHKSVWMKGSLLAQVATRNTGTATWRILSNMISYSPKEGHVSFLNEFRSHSTIDTVEGPT